MSVDELKGFIRTLAFGASIETQFKINEALALIDSLAAKAKIDDTLAKSPLRSIGESNSASCALKRVDPDSWSWLPTQRR